MVPKEEARSDMEPSEAAPQQEEEPPEDGFRRPSLTESMNLHLEKRRRSRKTRLAKEGNLPRKRGRLLPGLRKSRRTPLLGASAGFDYEGR